MRDSGGAGGLDEAAALADLALDLADDDEQRRTRIAWLYYVEGRTQSEIGQLLGLNRIKVNRDLAACRESGLVQIRINGRLAGCVALERKLQSRFGLAESVVIPTPGRPGDLVAAIGLAAGNFLSERLAPGMTIGVGWGRTLRWTARAMTRRRVEDLTIVSLMGGLGRASQLNTYETASRLAEMFEAACFYMAAPTYAASRQLRDLLLEHAGLQQIVERARRADLIVASVGSLLPDTTMTRLGLLSEAERSALLAAGAVGDLLCHFLDEQGRLVDHPINEQVVGLSPLDLSGVPARVLASGGADKVRIIKAVLAAGLVTAIVTDEATAAAVLSEVSPA